MCTYREYTCVHIEGIHVYRRYTCVHDTCFFKGRHFKSYWPNGVISPSML